MDNELLARLLATHNRLIIPNFGAFLRKETTSGSRQIVFSPFLKKDDGVLTQILIEEYGVEHFDAESMITEWVAHIKDALAANQKYHIEDIGVLVVDANGALTMVASPAKPAVPAPKPATAATTPVVTPTIEAAHIAQHAPTVAPEPVAAPVIPQPIAQPAAPQPIAQPKPVIPQPAPQPTPQPIAQPAPQPIAQPQVPQMQGRPAIPSLNTANVARPTPAAPPRPMATISQPNNPAQQNWQRPAAPIVPAQGATNNARPNNNPNIAGRQAGQPPVGNRQTQNTVNRPPQGNGQPGAPTQQRPAGPIKQGQRPQQRDPRGKQQKKQVETLLIIAIIAAILITALIIYGLLTVNPTNQIYNGEI